MATLRTCSGCKSTVDISYFGMNRKKEPYKTCENCRNRKKNVKGELNKPVKDSFIGENRDYGGSLLYKDLIPSSSWYNNVRKLVTTDTWDEIRKKVYERVNYK